MQTQYYVPEDKRQLPDVESIQLFFSKTPRGELFLDNNLGLKVVYDAHEGTAKLDYIQKKTEVTTLIPVLLVPILQAMRCLAKNYLLSKVDELQDDRLCQVIGKVKRDGVIPLTTKEEIVDDILREVINYIRTPKTSFVFFFQPNRQTEVQKTLYDVFVKFNIYTDGLNNINSIKIATEIMDKVNNENRQQLTARPQRNK